MCFSSILFNGRVASRANTYLDCIRSRVGGRTVLEETTAAGAITRFVKLSKSKAINFRLVLSRAATSWWFNDEDRVCTSDVVEQQFRGRTKSHRCWCLFKLCSPGTTEERQQVCTSSLACRPFRSYCAPVQLGEKSKCAPVHLVFQEGY